MNIATLIVFVCLFGLVQSVQNGKRIPYFAGPFRIVFKRMTNETVAISSGKVWSKIYFSPAKPGQLQYRWGYTHVGTDITDEYKMDIEMSVWANNQWKKNAFVMKFQHACSDLMKFASSMAKLVLGCNDFVCPIKRGPRVLQNETFDIAFPRTRIFPYGRYRATATVSKGAEIATVYVALCDFVPRV